LLFSVSEKSWMGNQPPSIGGNLFTTTLDETESYVAQKKEKECAKKPIENIKGGRNLHSMGGSRGCCTLPRSHAAGLKCEGVGLKEKGEMWPGCGERREGAEQLRKMKKNRFLWGKNARSQNGGLTKNRREMDT